RGPLHRWPAAWHVCKTVTYQKVTDQESSTLLGQVCERTSRVEFFEGHARSGDIRATNYAGNELTWAPQQRDRWNAEASRARSRHEPDPRVRRSWPATRVRSAPPALELPHTDRRRVTEEAHHFRPVPSRA